MAGYRVALIGLGRVASTIDDEVQDRPSILLPYAHMACYREVPADPMTGSNQSWKIEMEDALRSVNQTEPGIFDVHSGSDKKGLDGTAYSDW